MIRSAVFSPDRVYRYELWRQWGESPIVAFIGLNPSTADETVDDPTIRRCIGFAKSWGCGGLVMLNLFAYRATDPRQLLIAEDPVGPDNDAHLKSAVARSDMTVAAWGVHGKLQNRGWHVVGMLGEGAHLQALGLTKDGYPRHPLYLPSATELVNLR